MSAFETLTVVVMHPEEFQVEEERAIPETFLQKVVRKTLRKSAPTETVTHTFPHLHTITLDNTSDVSRFDDIAYILDTSRHDWKLVSVVVTDAYGSDELVEKFTTVVDVSEFFTAMMRNEAEYESYVAYVKEIEFPADMRERYWLSDNQYGRYEDMTAFAIDFTENGGTSLDSLPEHLSIDWEETAEVLSTYFSVVRHNGNVFVFNQ